MYERDNPKLIEFQGNREIILKARQMGFSTYIAVKMFQNTINTPLTQSIIVAQDENNSKRIFQMIKRFYDNLPPHKKRPTSRESTTELYWEDIDSYFTVGWAGSKKLGRGGTINNVHWSEPAFAENGRELVTGLLQAVPLDGNIWLESTANGVGNYYYTEYMAALEGKSIYSPRFYPWFLCQEYQSDRLILGGEFIIDPEEEELRERVYAEFQYTLTDFQLIWRRNKILELRNASLTDDSVGDFAQEYPSTVLEAFIATGSSFFDQKHIVHNLIPRVKQPIPSPQVPIKFPELGWVNKRTAGKLDIYQFPQPGRRYIVTGDPSEGLNMDGDHDYSSCDVYDADTFEQVVTLHGRWEPHYFAQLLYDLGMWYNLAIINIERNNHGHTVLYTLITELGYPTRLPNQWGGIFVGEDKKPGFHTNTKTKGVGYNLFNKIVSDDSLQINSKRTLEQMRIFSHLPGNKLGAASGHDDCVTSSMLAAVILTDSKIMKRQLKESGGNNNQSRHKLITTKRKTGFV